jgi:hypothetical protein
VVDVGPPRRFAGEIAGYTSFGLDDKIWHQLTTAEVLEAIRRPTRIDVVPTDLWFARPKRLEFRGAVRAFRSTIASVSVDDDGRIVQCQRMDGRWIDRYPRVPRRSRPVR